MEFKLTHFCHTKSMKKCDKQCQKVNSLSVKKWKKSVITKLNSPTA